MGVIKRFLDKYPTYGEALLWVGVVGVIILAVYLLSSVANAATDEENQVAADEWKKWNFVQNCEFIYADGVIGTGPLTHRVCKSTWVYTPPTVPPPPDPDPEPEPDPVPGDENIAEIVSWSCFNESVCSGEPVDGTLSIAHGPGDKNSPGAGSDQPFTLGTTYRIQYAVVGCTAVPCRHRFASGQESRSEVFEDVSSVDQTFVAGVERLNFSLQTSDPNGKIEISNLFVTESP